MVTLRAFLGLAAATAVWIQMMPLAHAATTEVKVGVDGKMKAILVSPEGPGPILQS